MAFGIYSDKVDIFTACTRVFIFAHSGNGSVQSMLSEKG